MCFVVSLCLHVLSARLEHPWTSFSHQQPTPRTNSWSGEVSSGTTGHEPPSAGGEFSGKRRTLPVGICYGSIVSFGGEALSFIARLHRLMNGHGSLTRQSLPPLSIDTSNIWAPITFSSYMKQNTLHILSPFFFQPSTISLDACIAMGLSPPLGRRGREGGFTHDLARRYHISSSLAFRQNRGRGRWVFAGLGSRVFLTKLGGGRKGGILIQWLPHFLDR